ncbi:type II toxin-antitoxin system VapC family toxin [Ruegeria sp. MALMAid1280]|uniref:type II toxin-antitoxin system VapC family toxin n=1 Tax=Ruegeria sp. MALMAid1280 TaxID=3411634 RepID=UPI003B9F03E8
MKFLLDTNAVIGIIAANSSLISSLSEHVPGDFAVPSVVMYELYWGAYKSAKVAENVARVDALRFEVLDLSAADAKAAGLIRADLYRKGTPIGAYDLLIAGQAVSRSLTLITNNVKEFRRIENLIYEDWQS